jgi:hypothetical protein
MLSRKYDSTVTYYIKRLNERLGNFSPKSRCNTSPILTKNSEIISGRFLWRFLDYKEHLIFTIFSVKLFSGLSKSHSLIRMFYFCNSYRKESSLIRLFNWYAYRPTGVFSYLCESKAQRVPNAMNTVLEGRKA